MQHETLLGDTATQSPKGPGLSTTSCFARRVTVTGALLLPIAASACLPTQWSTPAADIQEFIQRLQPQAAHTMSRVERTSAGVTRIVFQGEPFTLTREGAHVVLRSDRSGAVIWAQQASTAAKNASGNRRERESYFAGPAPEVRSLNCQDSEFFSTPFGQVGVYQAYDGSLMDHGYWTAFLMPPAWIDFNSGPVRVPPDQCAAWFDSCRTAVEAKESSIDDRCLATGVAVAGVIATGSAGSATGAALLAGAAVAGACMYVNGQSAQSSLNRCFSDYARCMGR